MHNDVVAIHVSKLYNTAKQYSLPGKEAQWTARRLVNLFKSGKLKGYQRVSNKWELVEVKELPPRIQFRGTNPETASAISDEFWKLVWKLVNENC